MLDSRYSIDSDFASVARTEDSAASYLPSADWKDIDRAISRLALRRAEADYEEGRWFLAAQLAAVHTRLGFATFFEYIERRLGYDARTTAEKLRVARSLARLPNTSLALKTGQRSWSAIRELTRVAVPETEAEWLSATDGKTVRQIEKLVAGRHLGDRPDQRSAPGLERRVIRFELSPESYARMKEAFERVRAEVDAHLSEEEALVDLCDRMLGGRWDGDAPPHQVLITKCEDCGRAWQKAKHESVEIGPVVTECADCDKVEIQDPHVGTDLERAKRTNPPALWRFIHHRDRGCCLVPGCKNTRYVAVHHFDLVSEGGKNDPDRMGLFCSTHHGLIHRGLLIIEGSVSTGLRFLHADGTEYGRPVRPADIDANATAFAGLKSLGFGEGEAKRLLSTARTHVGTTATAEVLLKAAVRATRSGGMMARETGAGPYGSPWPGAHVGEGSSMSYRVGPPSQPRVLKSAIGSLRYRRSASIDIELQLASPSSSVRTSTSKCRWTGARPNFARRCSSSSKIRDITVDRVTRSPSFTRRSVTCL